MALIRTGGGDTTPKINVVFIPSTGYGMSVCYEDSIRKTAGGPSSGIIFSDACGLKISYSGSNVYVIENVSNDAITFYNRASTTPETEITIAAGASQNVTTAQGLFIEFT